MTPSTYEVEWSDADYDLIRQAAHAAHQSIGGYLRAGNQAATVLPIAADVGPVAVLVAVPCPKVVSLPHFLNARFFPPSTEAA